MKDLNLVLHFVKIAWRNVKRYFNYSLLNIIGLAIAISVFYLLTIYVQDEYSYDRFHPDSERIYRVISRLKTADLKTAMSAQPWGPQLNEEISGIESYSRNSFYSNNIPIEHDDDIIFQDGIMFVDSLFLDVFQYPVLKGSKFGAIDDPSDVVITASMADKFFENQDAVGNSLRVNFNGQFRDYIVSAVIEDPPANAHHSFKMIFSKTAEYDIFNVDPNNWRLHNGMTYIKVRENITEKEIEDQFYDFFLRNAGEAFVNRYEPSLQPVTDIHLKSDLFEELEPNGNINYVKIAMAMAIFILLIGCVNYVNLSTALSVKRAKEVGSRKVFGAIRRHLISQFMVESIVISIIAVLLSVLIINFTFPYFNEITGKNLEFDLVTTLASLMGIGILAGLISGIYPAFFISGFKPIEVLKGKFQNSTKGLFLRRSLIICQFTLSIVLFIGTGVIYQQVTFMRDKELGFNQEGVIIANGPPNSLILEKFDVMQNNLLQVPGILNVTSSSAYPGAVGQARRYRPEGFEGDDESLASLHTVYGDFNLPSSLELEIIAGRTFDPNIATDTTAYIINQAAAEHFGFLDPIGKVLTASISGSTELTDRGRIIGMVKDFHFESFHTQIYPLVICVRPQFHFNVMVKHDGTNPSQALAAFKNEWSKQFPQHAFNEVILQDFFDELHTTEFQLQKILIACSVLAIVIACLGLFGLATFLAQQKVKEIGIRKVLGASRLRILFLLNKEFSLPIMVALLFGAVSSYYLMNAWLAEFVYRIDFNFWLIPAAGLIAIVVASLTVSFNTLKTTNVNPVDVLRGE